MIDIQCANMVIRQHKAEQFKNINNEIVKYGLYMIIECENWLL